MAEGIGPPGIAPLQEYLAALTSVSAGQQNRLLDGTREGISLNLDERLSSAQTGHTHATPLTQTSLCESSLLTRVTSPDHRDEQVPPDRTWSSLEKHAQTFSAAESSAQWCRVPSRGFRTASCEQPVRLPSVSVSNSKGLPLPRGHQNRGFDR
jgi:hypothetical protein